MPLQPVGAPSPEPPPAPPAVRPADARADFASILATQLAEPRSAIAEVRAEIASARAGGPGASRRAPRFTSASTASSASTPLANNVTTSANLQAKLRDWAVQGTGKDDPYGWRAMTRAIGDSAVGPGFGTLFERQIAQESGFAPDVVFGLRKSTAGAEGIAQLMPQFYAGVDRLDPQAALVAGAGSMRHYLSAFDGDIRKALASYNSGMGRVQQLIATHGAEWERGLPTETKDYLAAIVGDARGTLMPSGTGAAVFGGRGPGGALSLPLDTVLARLGSGSSLDLRGLAGAGVRAPADAVITAIQRGGLGSLLRLDHGNGWATTFDGLGAFAGLGVGDRVTRGGLLGNLGRGDGSEALLRMGLSLQGRALDPRQYLLG